MKKEVLAGLVLTAVFAISAWTLKEVVDMKVQIAVLASQFADHTAQKHVAKNP